VNRRFVGRMRSVMVDLWTPMVLERTSAIPAALSEHFQHAARVG